METEAQNIAIAGLLGREWHRPTQNEIQSGSYYSYWPDFTRSLDLIHAAIRTQPLQIQRTISQNLTNRLMTVKGDQWDDNLALILATPEMLCEQLLRAAGKWEGGK